MKTRALLFFLLIFGGSLSAQEVDTDGCPIFLMENEGVMDTMKRYFMVLYLAGDNQNHSKEEIAEIQTGHMAHIGKMAKEANLITAGPFEGDAHFRGVLVFAKPNAADVEAWVNKDPAVLAGRLSYKLLPWWSSKSVIECKKNKI